MNKMLVVVDYQKDFVDGSLGFPGAEKLDAGIATTVREATQNGDIIIVTRDTHSDGYLQSREGKALPVEHCIANSDGWKLFGETGRVLSDLASPEQPYDNLYLLDKETFGVHPGAMAALIERHPVDEVKFVGLVTNMCILSNVCCFQACFPGAQMVVDASLVASFDKQLHEKTLDVMAGMQVRVENREWGGSDAE